MEDADLPGFAHLDAFCEALAVERGASPHTIRAYRDDVLADLRWAQRAGMAPYEVSYRQLRRYLAELDQARYARTTIKRHLSALRSFFRWLNAVGLTTNDPVSVVQAPKGSHRLPKTISNADMAALLKVFGDEDELGRPRQQTPSDMRDQAILEFLFSCGARVSEAS